MKKLLLISFLFFSSLQAEGTYSGVYFSDYEEAASLYLCNYYPKQTFKDIGLGNTVANTIINNRIPLYTSISQIDNLTGIGSTYLSRIVRQSHLIEWNLYTDDFGLTLHQTNFLYGLTGLLLGFVFLLGFVLIIVQKDDN